jgi:hypothetical protein
MPFPFFKISSHQVPYSEGQVWAYKTRAGEDQSTVIINKVESDPKFGSIFHISVTGVRAVNPHIAGGFQSELPHFPVSLTTLEQSLTRLVRQGKPNPNFKDGYKEWKSAFDQGKAGVFTTSIAELVDLIESAMASR